MFSISVAILLIITLCVLDPCPVEAAIVSVSLTRGQGPPRDRVKTQGSYRFVTLIPERDDRDFWFASFSIGASQNLSILIDTGSTDLLLNPGIYKPSKSAIALPQSFSMRYGTTNSDGSGEEIVNGTVFQDMVQLDTTNLSVPFQSIGISTRFSPTPGPPFPHDGLMGFFVPGSAFGNDVPNWFSSLCQQPSVLGQCSFGLALEPSSNMGVLYLGGVQRSRFIGELSIAAMHERYIFGDVAVGEEIIYRDATIMIDSGTTVSWGPIESVQKLFDAAGIRSIRRNTDTNLTTTLDGVYPCDTPPRFSFGFPSESHALEASISGSKMVSHARKLFSILPEALAEHSNEQGDCYASIHGIEQDGDAWILGQGFFHGRYIDHNVKDHSLGFADLI